MQNSGSIVKLILLENYACIMKPLSKC